MNNSDGEKVTDNEFYMITFEDFMGQIRTVNIHLRNDDTVEKYMTRFYCISKDNIHCIYKRIYAK